MEIQIQAELQCINTLYYFVFLVAMPKLMGLAAIVLGVLKQSSHSKLIIGLGVCCYLLSLASVLMSKTLFASGLVGELALKPLAIFCFLLLLKNILLMANEDTKIGAL